MKRWLSFLLAWTCFTTSICAQGTFIVITGNDFNVLEAQDEHEVRSIASISKIMTAVIALQQGDYIDQWIIGDEVKLVTGSMIWLEEGQQVSMRSLLYGLMLKSGNDAAVAIAHRVSGSVEKFVDQMNKKAKELGMKDTTFHNPNGMDVDEEGNYSTAYDMALLMQHAMTIPQFREIVSTQSYTSEWGRRWKNSNKLLEAFPFCTGGKTGFTNKAGETLVTAAQNGEIEYIIVSLNVANRWQFHQEKYEEYMPQCELKRWIEKGTFELDGYQITLDEPFEVVVTKDDLQDGQLTTVLDQDKGEYQVSWKDASHEVTKTYKAKKIKNQFCLLGWCL